MIPAEDPPTPREPPRADAAAHTTSWRASMCPIVGLGASAGGLEAVTALLAALPPNPGAAFVLVMHLSAGRQSGLVQILERQTSLRVVQVDDAIVVEPNHLYVISAGTELTIADGVLTPRPRNTGQVVHKPIDLFFRSLADDQRDVAIGVVLSGADSDGADGLRAIKLAGGVTFAQDESAKVPSMPRAAVATGFVDRELPPEAIAAEIAVLGRLASSECGARVGDGAPPAVDDATLRDALELLQRSGADFTQYKQATIRRRIQRRMALRRLERPDDFLSLLRSSPAELQALHNDLLINVTAFFRDPEAFHAIELALESRLATRANPDEPVRIWVPGCATGEEVYSLAMCLLDVLDRTGLALPVQMFGTDLSARSVEVARTALYPANIAAVVPEARLRRYFAAAGDGYQVVKAVRDLCVFAQHDVTRDPPFSRLDLISCRNVLIYFASALQKRVYPIFHYALKRGGCLFLGSSETAPADLFAPVDARARIYAKIDTRLPIGAVYSAMTSVSPRPAPKRPDAPPAPAETEIQREADRLLLGSYAPPGVIVDRDDQVIQFRGRTGAYLEPPPGRVNMHLLAMLREGLLAAVVSVLERVRGGAPSAEAPARVEVDGRARDVVLRALPLGEPAAADAAVLLLFDEGPGRFVARSSFDLGADAPADLTAAAATIARLRAELQATRVRLQAQSEAHDAAVEELQSANEEMLSSNEEMQSANEELETSREEIQSTNEELGTVNDELQARNADLARASDDLANVLTSVDIPLLILTSDQHIRRFTPAAAKAFRLLPGDVGRPVSHINLGLSIPALDRIVSDVLGSLELRELEAQDQAGRWYLVRVRPYRTMEGRVEGIVIAAVDVDESHRSRAMAEAERDYAATIVETVRQPILVLDGQLAVITANREFCEWFQVSREESERRRVYDLGSGQWNIPALRSLLEETIPRDHEVRGFRVTHSFPHLGRRVMLVDARRIAGGPSRDPLILMAIRDVTEREEHEAMLLDRERQLVGAHQRKDEFLAMLAHELRNPLTPIVNAVSLLRRSASPESKKLLEIMARQTNRMARLIDDLLDVSRITRGKVLLRREPTDLARSIATAVESSQPTVTARHHRLEVALPDVPLVVDADPARLEQVVANLIDNAAKYTQPGGDIRVTVERDGDFARISVRDTGMGIAPEVLPHVFDLFTQAERGADRGQGGLGIGLTVVRSLVEMHGGSVEARSEGPERGSEFVLRWPLASAPTVRAEDQREAGDALAGESTPRRVLVVEDGADAAETMKALLASWGHEVHLATDGLSGVARAAELDPDVILLDVGLPGLDGYEVAARVRARREGKRPFIIAMTGYGRAEDRARSAQAGIDAHLVKPADPGTLRRLVAESNHARERG